MSAPGDITTPETRRLEARKLAVESLALDLLAFLETSAASSTDGELKARAVGLAARIDVETERFAKQIEDRMFCGEHRVSVSTCGCGSDEV